MKYTKIQSIVFVILISLTTNAQSLETTVKGNNAFAFEIFKEVFNTGANVFISPYSISSVLAMTYAGARNETEKQMSEVLHFDLTQVNTHQGFSAINKELNRTEAESGIKLAIANALWKNSGPFNKDYMTLIKKYYDSSLFSIINADTINQWVKRKTYNKIDKLVTSDDVAGADLVLTNAIYFKGDWLQSFDVNATQKAKFTTIDNKVIDVDMMSQCKTFNYFADNQCQVLELPYKGNSVSMIIMLPDNNISLADFVKNANSKLFEDYCKKLNRETVEVRIPKFTFSSEFTLNDVLIRMGMPDAFTADADFSGMAPGLFISLVKHKAFIEVNEKGSEAAAATAVVMTKSVFGMSDFIANRPFVFLIRDNKTNSILFIGSILNPNSK
jgi:serpin B